MSLARRKIIVTGGPTREWIDPVRYISNASSGKMGIALADAAYARGYVTVFIHGPINEHMIRNKPYISKSVQTTEELLHQVVAEIDDNAILIMAAAPADYRPVDKKTEKIKKTGDDLVIHLKKNPDILKEVARKKLELKLDNLFVVGFAAETNNVEEYALDKLQAKNLDMICLNDVTQTGAGFGADTNIMILYKKNGARINVPLQSKDKVAEAILSEIEATIQR